jgi:hypothetical protein
MVYHSLLSTTILQEIAMVDSPWMLVRDRAEKAGIQVILSSYPLLLLSFVIFHCSPTLLCLISFSLRGSTGTFTTEW